MLISIFAFLAVFSLVVLVHEFGHFLAARRAGVKVYEFSIGFPFSPKVLTFFRHKETEFTLRLLPLGGFVSFSQEGDEGAKGLFAAPYSARAAILSAGSLSNSVFAFLLLVPVFIIGKDVPLADAISASAGTLWAIVSGTFLFIFNIFSGNGSVESLTGPVGIAHLAGQAAAKGFLSLMYFTGILSMSLGVMNLLPLPALDGGQLLMLAVETVKRKPLRLKTYQTVNAIGLLLFIALTLAATHKDIVRLAA
jgi:regulator of sigma E protease